MPSKNTGHIQRIKFSKLTTYFLLLFALLAFIAVIYFLLAAYGIDLLSLNENKGQESFFIADQCSYLAGQLLHTINIADECSLKCRSECSVMNKEYSSENFVFGNNTCNSCMCVCK